LFGLEITRAKALRPTPTLSPPSSRGGWWPVVREPFTGAWQRNIEVTLEDSLSYWAQFRCISLISGDIAKMRLNLVEQDENDIWTPTYSPAFSPVLEAPNGYQNRIQFIQSWMESKLARGNTYVLKARDQRNVVTELYVLDPTRTRPLVAPDGSVYYQLYRDDLSGIPEDMPAVPASEIIHDRWNTLYHPLCGLPPLYAAGINSLLAAGIQRSTAQLFLNGAQPTGVLTSPHIIDDAKAEQLRERWKTRGPGQVAVLGDGLTFQPISTNAVESDVINQLKWTDSIIAGVYGVPAYMINAGTAPAYNNVEALNQQYYSQCLQIHIESIEQCLNVGLGLLAVPGEVYGTRFNLDDLLRMDSATQIKSLGDAVKGILSADEARKKLNYPPTPGGKAVLSQQQNFSLEALARRDAQADPFGTAPKPAPQPQDQTANDNSPDNLAATQTLAGWAMKAFFERDGSESFARPFLRYDPNQPRDDDGRWTDTGADFPIAGEKVSGLIVDDDVPNSASIGASLDDYTVQEGIREIPFSAFSAAGNPTRDRRTNALAEAIEQSGHIKPLIVVIEEHNRAAGPYILEGAHRFDALQILKKKTFPALVVIDHQKFGDAAKGRKFDPNQPRDDDGRWTDTGGGTISEPSGDPQGMSHENVQKVVNEVAKDLDFDPTMIEIVDGKQTFELNGLMRSAAGLARTDKIGKDEKVITIFANNVNFGNVDGVIAHEIEHIKYETALNRYRTDFNAIMAEPGKTDDVMRADGSLKPAYADKYPAYTVMHEALHSHGTMAFATSDGVSDYSYEWWNRWIDRGKHGVDAKSAMHETLAEMARVKYTTKEFPDHMGERVISYRERLSGSETPPKPSKAQIEKNAKLWRNLYGAVDKVWKMK